MRLNNLFFFFFIGFFFLNTSILSCNKKAEIPYVPSYTSDQDDDDDDDDDEEENETPPRNIKLLSLGDSYTIGQSVCDRCRFPEQLKDSLIANFDEEDTFSLNVIAQTGWTTTNLKSAIESANLTSDFDLVTLLIGVNNQYQGKPFSLYETEFVELTNTAIALAGNDASKLIVVSIPDYAYTPFGQNGNPETISEELELYNNFAQNYCEINGLSYVYITDITQQGLENPNLVAADNLHPSTLAYTQFVERILPLAIEKIE
jgi:lysophospholipase L1-like esterase